jgi:feruloyl esterase
MRPRFAVLCIISAFIASASIKAAPELDCVGLRAWLGEQLYISEVGGVGLITTGITARCELDFTYSSREGLGHGYADGQSQRIRLRVGLPRNSTDGGTGGLVGAWNGKVQNLGGGGLVGMLPAVLPATVAGYVGSSTDSGHTVAENPDFAVIQETNSLNYGKLDDFLIESVRQQYQWALRLAEVYYGTPATRNYWAGCSTGGRQGLSLALAEGDAFDGFLVGAPANYNSRLQLTALWPRWVDKDVTGNTLTSAQFNAAGIAAVQACDAQDGVADGLLADPRKCRFDARSQICGMPGAPATDCLQPEQAQAINMMWDGPRNDEGTRIWFPYERGASMGAFLDLPHDPCGSLGAECWAHRDMTFDWGPLPLSQFDDETMLATNVVAPYSDIMSTALHAAKNRNAKILMWHGAADNLIPHRQSIHYYNEAIETFGGLNEVKPWFRFFIAPGVGHCGGGPGPQPENLFNVLVNWVENGVVPNSIPSSSIAGRGGATITRSRPLCPWPQEAIFNGIGDQNVAANWRCGGHLETKETVCFDLVAKFQNETLKGYDTRGQPNLAVCNSQ